MGVLACAHRVVDCRTQPRPARVGAVRHSAGGVSSACGDTDRGGCRPHLSEAVADHCASVDGGRLHLGRGIDSNYSRGSVRYLG